MATLMLDIKTEKQDWFLSLLKEFNFISNIELIDAELETKYKQLVLESETDIDSGKLTSQIEIEQEVLSWKKR
jgi:phage anti-repressor protein